MGFGETLVSLAGVCGLFVLPVVAWMFSRVLKHRERMAMYRSGYVTSDPAARRMASAPPPATATGPGRGCGRRDGRLDDDPQHALRKGVVLAMIGMALTIGLSFVDVDNGHIHPGPWLLGGLIPLFVGLSNVILALLSGASLGNPRFEQRFGPPPDAPPPGAPPDDRIAYGGSYTYRPGPERELLPPPTPPRPR